MVYFALGITLVQAQQAPRMEAYSARPSVLTAPPVTHDMDGYVTEYELGLPWESLVEAQFSFVVELLNLYHDHEIYFLARDAEILYDAATLVAQGNQRDRQRIHLLNVSRANMNSSHLKAYLAQEGISDEALSAGKQVLLVDTGFMGSVSEVIENQFRSELRPQISTHLLLSGTATYPLSRVFLNRLGLPFDQYDADQFRPLVLVYEDLPSFTDRSTEYALVNGRWEAMSPMGGQSSDGQVSKTKARHIQEDLYARFNTYKMQEKIQREGRLWRRLMHLYYGPATRPQKRAMVKHFLAQSDDKELREAMVRDILDREQASRIPPTSARLRLSDLGLSDMYSTSYEDSRSYFPSEATLQKGQCINILMRN